MVEICTRRLSGKDVTQDGSPRSPLSLVFCAIPLLHRHTNRAGDGVGGFVAVGGEGNAAVEDLDVAVPLDGDAGKLELGPYSLRQVSRRMLRLSDSQRENWQ